MAYFIVMARWCCPSELVQHTHPSDKAAALRTHANAERERKDIGGDARDSLGLQPPLHFLSASFNLIASKWAVLLSHN